jgi:hypothetical protein
MPEFVMRDWLAPSELSWPDDDTGPWKVKLDWRESAGEVYCAGLAIQPLGDAPSQPITASLMRAIPVGQLVARARRQRWELEGGALLEAVNRGVEMRYVSDDGEPEEDFYLSDSARSELEGAVLPWAERRRGRPKHLDGAHFREVARTYSAALASGQPPLRAIQSRWTVSKPTASRWVASAREAGLLPPTERGRARGDLNLLTQPEGDE